MASNVEHTLDLLECALCYGTLTTNDHPKSLPCLHTFCTPCLTIKQGQHFIQDTNILCPVCHSIVGPSTKYVEIIENLKPDTIIEKLFHVRQLQQSEHICGMCAKKGVLSTNWCLECEQFLCNSCVVLHGRCRPKDKVIDLSQGFDCCKVSDFNLPTKCSSHEKNVETYCAQCKICLCPSCLLEHSDRIRISCMPIPIEKDALDKKNNGEKLLERMRSRIEEQQKHIADMELEIVNLEKQYAEKSVEIWDHVEETVKKIKENVRALVAEMESVRKSEVSKLKESIQLKEDHIKEIEITELYFRQLLQNFNATDIILNYPRFESTCGKILGKNLTKAVPRVVKVTYDAWYLNTLAASQNVPLARFLQTNKNPSSKTSKILLK